MPMNIDDKDLPFSFRRIPVREPFLLNLSLPKKPHHRIEFFNTGMDVARHKSYRATPHILNTSSTVVSWPKPKLIFARAASWAGFSQLATASVGTTT